MVALDRLLRGISENRIGTAAGHNSHFAKEHSSVREDTRFAAADTAILVETAGRGARGKPPRLISSLYGPALRAITTTSRIEEQSLGRPHRPPKLREDYIRNRDNTHNICTGSIRSNVDANSGHNANDGDDASHNASSGGGASRSASGGGASVDGIRSNSANELD